MSSASNDFYTLLMLGNDSNVGFELSDHLTKYGENKKTVHLETLPTDSKNFDDNIKKITTLLRDNNCLVAFENNSIRKIQEITKGRAEGKKIGDLTDNQLIRLVKLLKVTPVINTRKYVERSWCVIS